MTKGTPTKGRFRLAAVVRSSKGVLNVARTSEALGIGSDKAAKLLSAWTAQGWLQRVGAGTYVPIDLEMLGVANAVADPWQLVPSLFGNAYVGGRTAAEHWDLTEQIFNDIVVFTSRTLRTRVKETAGAKFTLRHISSSKLFGTTAAWRGQIKVQVSDLDRTMLDMLDDPQIGGGIQHVEDCFANYLLHKESNQKRLIEYADRLANGAVFKRLGFLAERNGNAAALLEICKSRVTKGNAKLDPSLKTDRLLSRWRLWVPALWAEGTP